MEEWILLKKITSLDLTKKCFETDEHEQSDEHEAQIPIFKKKLEEEGHEIFNVVGRQFITNEGVFTIAHKSEIEYGE